VAARFFGEPAVFPDGPARLARLTGAPIVFGAGLRRGGGRYHVQVCAPILSDRELGADDDIRRMTQELARTLEGFVRRAPAQWYAFRDVWAQASE
jgi:lauroyl/myristoyl acyltransferase